MSGDLPYDHAERQREINEERAADLASYSAHVQSAQENGDLDGVMARDRHPEIVFNMDDDGALYSFVGDRSGLTIRCTEAGSLEVKSLWIPSTLFGAMRRAVIASQEVKE